MKKRWVRAIPSLGRGREGFNKAYKPLPATALPAAPLPWGGKILATNPNLSVPHPGYYQSSKTAFLTMHPTSF
jgi:hypothetical protein